MNRIEEVLTDLSTCLCAQLLTDGAPPLCFCGIVPGVEVAMDYAGDCEGACGMAWVRLVTAYPSVTVGAISDRPGNCGLGLGLEVEMGVVRCIDLGSAETPTSPAELAAATVIQTADMMAMWRAVACCRTSRDWVIGSYSPTGPEGGLVGGVLPLGILVI